LEEDDTPSQSDEHRQISCRVETIIEVYAADVRGGTTIIEKDQNQSSIDHPWHSSDFQTTRKCHLNKK